MSSIPLVTIVIPFHIDSEDRAENLSLLVSWLQRCQKDKIKGWEIVLSEKGSSGMSFPGCVHVVNKIETGGFFSRSEGINRGVADVRSPVFVVWDSDLVMDLAYVGKSCSMVLEYDRDMVIPHSGVVWDVPRFSLSLQEAENDLYRAAVQSPRAGMKKMVDSGAVGGICCFDTARFREIGGMNEYFTTYGYEDHEILFRAGQMGLCIAVHTQPPGRGDIFHLHHVRSDTAWYGDMDRTKSCKLYTEIRDMSRTQLQEYIKAFPWLDSLGEKT